MTEKRLGIGVFFFSIILSLPSMPVGKDTLMFFESMKGNNCKFFIVNLPVTVYVTGDNGFANRLTKI